jgi:heptosyltransferase-2
MRHSPSAEPSGRRLLVPQTSFLGDVVLATPLLSALRARLRPAHLAVLVRPEAAALLENHPDVDRVLVDDKRGRDRGVRGLLRTAARLRRERFDLVVSPHRSLRTALVLALAGIPRRVGFADSRGAAFYHVRVRRDRRSHEVERNLALLAPFGGAPGTPRLYVAVDSQAARRVATLLPPGAGPLVGIAPGSVWATKRWTIEGFAAVAAGLAADGARCVILGGAEDRARAEAIAAGSGGRAVVLAGRTDVAGLVALVDRLALLIGNDSAPVHVACARGVPVVAVFGATTPALGYGPWGRRAVVVEADAACRPCGRHGGPVCPRGTEDCLRLVRPEAVLAAARAALAQTRRAGATG